MNDQDLIHRLTGPRDDPEPQAVQAAFSDVRRRSQRRARRRSGAAVAGAAAVTLVAAVWASGASQSPADNLTAGGAPGTVQPGPAELSGAEEGPTAVGVRCGAVPDPADRAGIAVGAPELHVIDPSAPPSNEPDIPVSFTNNSGDAVQITTSQLQIVALDERGAIVSRAGNGGLEISSLDLEPGETGRADAFAPTLGCGPTREPLAPGTYDVAVAFPATTGEGRRLLRSSIGSTTTGPETLLDPDTGALTVALPGRDVNLQLTDEAAAAAPSVRHQAGFQRDGFGYDVEVSVGADALGPCLGTRPCVEVGTGRETAGGLLVRSWAPDLVGGKGPSSPVYVTATSPDGITLNFRSRYAGGALSGEDIAGLLVVDPASWLGISLGPDHQALTWNGTFVNPPPVDGTFPWSVYLSPTCAGSDLCDDGVGASTMARADGAERPLSELVSQLSTEPR